MNAENVTETPTAPATAAPEAPHVAQVVVDVERQFRERDSGAFFVLPRVVRRVLQNELNITTNWVPPPHRKSCVVERDQLLWLVARDELGVDADAVLPQRMILIARPEEDKLDSFTREDLLRYYWRLLFHARIDFELELKTSVNRMTTAELRRRIDSLGQTQFDEIRSVLRAEHMLRRPEDARHVYAEFVAVYHELREFAPNLIPLYFPSLPSQEAVLATIGPDCDAGSLLEATRPAALTSAETVPVATTAPAAAAAAAKDPGVGADTRRVGPAAGKCMPGVMADVSGPVNERCRTQEAEPGGIMAPSVIGPDPELLASHMAAPLAFFHSCICSLRRLLIMSPGRQGRQPAQQRGRR